jgi:hypothetical protein
VTGNGLFRGSPAEVMHQHQHAPLPLEQLKGVPQSVAALLHKLLEKDPAKRFQNPAELLQTVSQILRSLAERQCRPTNADALERALPTLYAAGGLDDFASCLVAAAQTLLPDHLVGYGFVDLASGRFRARHDLDQRPWSPALETLIYESPMFHYLMTPSAESVVRLGDLTTLREFRRSALYQECMRPMGVRRELCLTLPVEGGLGALAVHRDGRDFSDRERDAFRRLWPHAVQAYRNARLLATLRAQNVRDVGQGSNDDFIDSLPPALRDAACQGLAWLEADRLVVRKLNPIGAAWLARFFPPGVRGSCLPEALRRVLSSWRQDGLRLGIVGSWLVESACGRLVMRAFPDCTRQGALLVMDWLPSVATVGVIGSND